jgi:hypothetical protein
VQNTIKEAFYRLIKEIGLTAAWIDKPLNPDYNCLSGVCS